MDSDININIINNKENINILKIENFFSKNEINHEENKSKSIKKIFQKGHIYIFTCIGLVASGKSTIINFLKENLIKKLGEENISFSIISSDIIRQKLENSLPKPVNPNDEKHSNKIAKSTKKIFDNEFHKKLQNYENQKFNFIVLDKNFFINTLKDLKL